MLDRTRIVWLEYSPVLPEGWLLACCGLSA